MNAFRCCGDTTLSRIEGNMLPLSEYLLHRDLVVVLIQPGQKRFEMVCRDPLPKKK
jgi:hypothetical protein